MLSRLHGHVEQEETRWSTHAADLQRQLDEAHRQLDNRIILNRGCSNSEDEGNDHENDD